ncbi:MAG: hypothetical protein JRI92_08950 [Deltaproteobacteria bacterium]|nr:hypothetical protein [Deltaproteobacteria bacterium]
MSLTQRLGKRGRFEIGSYTCRDYRQEMMLLGLKNRLSSENLSDEEKRNIVEEIKKLETVMCMD